jgi:hypothetical protein
LPCELKITRAISQSQRIDNSMAFLTSPFLRLANVACRLRSSLMRAIFIFLRPISVPNDGVTVSQRSSFRLASRSASFALLCPEEDVLHNLGAEAKAPHGKLAFSGCKSRHDQACPVLRGTHQLRGRALLLLFSGARKSGGALTEVLLDRI